MVAPRGIAVNMLESTVPRGGMVGLRRALVGFGLLVVAGWARAGDDPFNGTWQLDLAKSTLAPAQPELELKGQTVVFEPNGKDFVVTVRGLRKNGASMLTRCTTPIGGGPVTYSEGAPPKGVTVITNRLDDRRLDFVTYQNRALVSVDHARVSADGKTLSFGLQGGVDPLGNAVSTCSNMLFVLTQKCGMSVFVKH
jgi:hypothetical protein